MRAPAIGGLEYLGARSFDELADMFDRDPAFLAARTAPALDAFQDRFRLVATEQPVDIDHDQRRALAEPGPVSYTHLTLPTNREV